MDIRACLYFSNSSPAGPPVPWWERHGWEWLKPLLERLGRGLGTSQTLSDSLASPWLQLIISQVGIHGDSFCQGMSSQAMWEPSGALELSTDDSINTRERCLVAASQDPPCWAANSWSSSKSERENFHLLPRLVPPCLQRLRWVWGNFILNQREDTEVNRQRAVIWADFFHLKKIFLNPSANDFVIFTVVNVLT